MRWTDQDLYGHLNNARTVTLLEEARVRFLFDAAGEEGVTGFSGGLLVAGLNVEYRRQVPYRPRPLRVTMWVDELRPASFRISYELQDGPDASDPVATRAWTRMAMVDMSGRHPRRLTAAEREFLGRWGAS